MKGRNDCTNTNGTNIVHTNLPVPRNNEHPTTTMNIQEYALSFGSSRQREQNFLRANQVVTGHTSLHQSMGQSGTEC